MSDETTARGGASPRAVLATLWVLAFVPNQAAPSGTFTLAVAACVAILLIDLGRSKQPLHVTRPVALVIVLHLSIVLSTYIDMQSLRDLLGPLRQAVLLSLLALSATRLNLRGREVVLRGIVWLACVEAGVGLAQKMANSLRSWGWLGQTSPDATFGENPIWGGAGRAPATLGHGIPLGMLMVVGLLIVLLAPGFKATTRIATTGLLVAGLAASGSRSPVIVGAFVLLVAIYTQRGFIANGTTKFFAPFALAIGLLLVDVRSLSLVDSLEGSVSLTNRQDSWGVFGRLLDMPMVNVLIGHGWDGLEHLRTQGYVGAEFAIDNNVVTTFMVGGAVALIALVALVVRGWKAGDAATRMCLLFLAGMFLSFDITLWAFPMALVVTLASLPAVSRERADESTERQEVRLASSRISP